MSTKIRCMDCARILPVATVRSYMDGYPPSMMRCDACTICAERVDRLERERDEAQAEVELLESLVRKLPSTLELAQALALLDDKPVPEFKGRTVLERERDEAFARVVELERERDEARVEVKRLVELVAEFSVDIGEFGCDPLDLDESVPVQQFRDCATVAITLVAARWGRGDDHTLAALDGIGALAKELCIDLDGEGGDDGE